MVKLYPTEKCERCGENKPIGIGYFNTQWLCVSCLEKEEAHPQYKKAKDAELEQTKAGNFSFEGIGKPADL